MAQSNLANNVIPIYIHPHQGCRKVVNSGGGNISDYVLLVVLYTSRSGGMPPRTFLVFLCSETAFSTI